MRRASVSCGSLRRQHAPGSLGRTPLGQIQAVTFDVGGTLIRPWPSVGHIYAEVAAVHGHPGLSPGLLNKRFAAAWNSCGHFQHSRAQWAELVDTTFFGLINAVPSRTFFAKLYARFARTDAWHIFEDVLPVLQALRARGLRLGVISNWDERLRPLLRRLHLQDYFATIVVSCEAGASKPSRAIFERAARELGLPPGLVLHVGDSRELDCLAAQAAGFAGVWLERRARPLPGGAIRSLRGLLPRLAGAGAVRSTRRRD